MYRMLSLILATLLSHNLSAQQPDALVVNWPIQTAIHGYPAGKYLQRTIFQQPCDTTAQGRALERIFAGVGRAYYGPDGKLVYFEQGYGGTPRIRLEPDRCIALASIGTWELLENRRQEWQASETNAGIQRIVWKPSTLGSEHELQVFGVDGRCRSMDWEDKWLEALPVDK